MTNISKSVVRALVLVSSAAGAFGGMALANMLLARKAERKNLPGGAFVDIGGEHLHYKMRGKGRSVVLLHGNASMLDDDFECSGIFDAFASKYHVVAFDRPGYGHSPRRGARARMPEEQADLIAAALSELGIEEAVILAHSWGTLVALQLALRHPNRIKGLVLESGYYFATPRADVAMATAVAIPGLGAILAHTIAPLLARLTWPMAVRSLFRPAEVPEKFKAFPRELALRPSQLRTSAEEAALMIPATEGLAEKCASLPIPTALVCGAGDQIVDPTQSARLHRTMKNSTLATLLFNGHMVHHTSPIQIEQVLAEVVRLSDRAPRSDDLKAS